MVVAGSLIAGTVLADDPSAMPKPDAQMQEMMKKAEAAGTPGKEHRALDALVGEWDAEVKTWMAPDAPPMVTRGSSKATWIMDGRFVQEEFNGQFMGKPFRGMSLTGYDNLKQKYTTLWIDDMSTAMYTSEGDATQGGAVFTFVGTMDCPMTGQKDMPMKQVLRIVSAEKHVFEMHDPSKGKDSKTMEITYTRK